MGVRFKKYFQQCKGRRSEGDRHGKVITKGIECEGKRGKHCPEGVPGTCGAWAIEFRDQHGAWKSVIKPGFTKTQAKEAYNEIVRNIQRGLFDLPVLRKMPKVTVEAYCQRYLERIKGLVPDNTLVNRHTAINAIVRHLGGIEVSRLNVVLVQRFCTDVMQKDNVKPSTVNQYCSILRLMLDMAVQEKVIDTNPMQGFKRLKVDEASKRSLTNTEIREILNESVLRPGWERTAILIGMFTGLRLMDVITLKWSNIDFNNSVLTITQQKTGRNIHLPLSGFLLGEMRKYKALVDNNKDCLFHDGEVNHKVAARFSQHFAKVFQGIGLGGVGFHVLRHTAGTKVTEVVQDVSVVSKMLGHASLNTTMNYIHRDMDTRKEAIEKFTNHMLALTEYESGTNIKTA